MANPQFYLSIVPLFDQESGPRLGGAAVLEAAKELPRQAPQRHPAGVLETTEQANVVLLQETGEPGSRLCHVCRLLQFLLADSAPGKIRQEAANSLYDGGVDRARLVV
jgi:hypothetical protein